MVSSWVVAVSSMASGGSLVLVTRTVTVAVSVPPRPSEIVYLKLASPTKFLVVSKVKTFVLLLSCVIVPPTALPKAVNVEGIAIRIGVVGDQRRRRNVDLGGDIAACCCCRRRFPTEITRSSLASGARFGCATLMITRPVPKAP